MTTEPATITTWRSMLLLCPSVVALGMQSADFVYPEAAQVTDNGITPSNKLPFAVLHETPSTRKRFMSPGTLGLPSGTVVAVFHFEGPDTGTVEAFARTLQGDLFSLGASDTLPLSSTQTELCAKPDPAAIAAGETQGNAADFMVQITAEYGLSA